MERKYILTNETKNISGVTLHRIKAMKDFGNIKAGDLGGWIEKESNLSHKGNCWVYGNACVFGNAEIFDNASIAGNARVSGRAVLYEDSFVLGKAKVFGSAEIFGRAIISDSAKIFENAKVYGDSCIYNYARIFGNAEILDKACVYEKAKVYGNSCIYNDARIFGNAEIFGNTLIGIEARISDTDHYFTTESENEYNEYITVYKARDSITHEDCINVNESGICGTPKQFIQYIKAECRENEEIEKAAFLIRIGITQILSSEKYKIAV